MSYYKNKDEETKQLPLLLQEGAATKGLKNHLAHDADEQESALTTRVWMETKKLWHVVGPSIFNRVAGYTMMIITQAIAGHLGEVELASISIAFTVFTGFSFGFLLGMASALETLCGQAFGAKKYHMLGIYMQRSWIILFLCCILLLPLYIFATPLLKALGQPDDVAEQTGLVALWFIPVHFSYAFQFPIQRFLISQLRTAILIWVSLVVFFIHVVLSWLFVYQFDFGMIGLVIALDISWWLIFLGQFAYASMGGCPDTWTGFSWEAFSGLWDYLKLSAASGVMLCLENWYYRILILMTGSFEDTTLAVDALSICMNINSWEMMIPLSFFAAAGVRVANELGANNGNVAKFAAIVAVIQSTIIGIIFSALILIFHDKYALIFSSSPGVVKAAEKLCYLLASTILLNSVQPVLSGVAVGLGWQTRVAYINLASYYLVGLPLGAFMGWILNWGIQGIWAGMIFGGTALQTIILAIITVRCDWVKEAKQAIKNVEVWSQDSINQS